MKSFAEVWSDLQREAAGRKTHAVLRRRVMPEAQRDLYLGWERPHDRRWLILRVHRDALPELEQLPTTRGVELRVERLLDDPEEFRSLIMRLSDTRFADVFAALAEDIARRVAPVPDDSAAVAEFTARLQKWQRFLEQYGPRGLGAEAQRGLYGELWFLREEILPAIGGRGVEYWVGSLGAPKDFQIASWAVEIKTSVTRNQGQIRIANERQLDDQGLQELFLCHIIVDEGSAAGESLPQIIQSLRGTLQTHTQACETFESRLLDAGYLESHADQYGSLTWGVRTVTFFQVGSGFPRIVGSDLPAGVEDVTYSVSINVCHPHEVPGARVREMLRNL